MNNINKILLILTLLTFSNYTLYAKEEGGKQKEFFQVEEQKSNDLNDLEKKEQVNVSLWGKYKKTFTAIVLVLVSTYVLKFYVVPKIAKVQAQAKEAQEKALLAEYYQKEFENNMIRWKRENPDKTFLDFMQNQFPENVKEQDQIDPRCLGDRWQGAFKRLRADQTLHAIAAKPPMPD